jgi:hypothetical protein
MPPTLDRADTNAEWLEKARQEFEAALAKNDDNAPLYWNTYDAAFWAWQAGRAALGDVPAVHALSDLNELAKVYASSYASPHHITFTVEGLRNLLAATPAAVPVQPERTQEEILAESAKRFLEREKRLEDQANAADIRHWLSSSAAVQQGREAVVTRVWELYQECTNTYGDASKSAVDLAETEGKLLDYVRAALAPTPQAPQPTELCNKGCEGVLLPHTHTERGQIMIAKVPLASNPKDREDVLRKALSAMLTHMGMDEDEWNKPTFDQARAALAFTAHPAASLLPAQAPAVPPLTILDVGFKYESGVHTPTVLVGFAPNDWDARDAFAASLESASTSEPAPQAVAQQEAQPSGNGGWCVNCGITHEGPHPPAPQAEAVQAPERTAKDYAIEHAEYMATDAERLLEAINALSAAELLQEEADEDDGTVADARDDVWSATRSLRSGIYEFRKRRDRARTLASASDAAKQQDSFHLTSSVPSETVQTALLDRAITIVREARDSIGAGALSENAQHERGIVGPYLDGIEDELRTMYDQPAQTDSKLLEQALDGLPSLYDRTGDVKDINTLLINRDELRVRLYGEQGK